MDDILLKLEKILEQRKTAKAEDSYVSSLYRKGTEEILKKIAEESTEVIMAAKEDDKDKVIYEVADLWFHTLVLLSHKNISVNAITDELFRRFGLSGLKEKASRKK